MIRFTAKEYLKIDIANNFGLDKEDWDVRIKWFDDNEPNLKNLINQAEEPALFFAGLQAWEEVNKGNPIGYPPSLDATASGMQILACLTGDYKAAMLCNLVNTGHRQDAYKLIYEFMLEATNNSSVITRELCKDAVMTSLYGSKAIPKTVFGEGPLLRAFFHTMKTVAPAVWAINELFLNIWDNTKTQYSWVLPDNFHVNIQVKNRIVERVHFLNRPIDTFRTVNMPVDNGRSLSANATHSVDGLICRELNRRCNYDPERIKQIQKWLFKSWNPTNEELPVTPENEMLETLWNLYIDTGYLSARILDYINEENINFIHRPTILELIESLPEKPFKVLTVHDCFRALPHYCNDLRHQYMLQMALLAKSKLLDSILTQMVGRPIQVKKQTEDLHVHIMQSEYPIT